MTTMETEIQLILENLTNHIITKKDARKALLELFKPKEIEQEAHPDNYVEWCKHPFDENSFDKLTILK